MTTSVITLNTTPNYSATTIDNQYTGFTDTNLKEEAGQQSTNFNTATRNDDDLHTERKNCILQPSGISNIDSAEIVSSSLLRMKQTSTNGTLTINFHRMLVSLGITTCTWLTTDGSTSWNTDGAEGSGTDRAATEEDSVSVGNDSNWYEWDVTSWAQNVIDGTYSLDTLLGRTPITTPDSIFKGFVSSNSTDGERPELVVIHSTPAGNPWYYYAQQ